MEDNIRARVHSGIILATAILLGMSIQNQALAQRQRMSPEDRTKQLKEQLSLTEEQTDSVLVIITNAQDEMRKAFRSSNGGDRNTMRGTVHQQREKTNDEIARLLTDEQKKKFDEIRNQPPPGGRRSRND